MSDEDLLLDDRVARLDALLERLAAHPDDEVREAVGELVAALRWLHSSGLERLVTLLAEDRERFARALDDPLVANLLMLYDLVAVDERRRALEALDSIRPAIAEAGGDAELVGVEDGVVQVRLLAADGADPSAFDTVQDRLEQALADRLPGFRGLHLTAGASGGDLRPSGSDVSVVPASKLRSLAARLEKEEPDEPRKTSRSGPGLVGVGGRSPRLELGRLEELPEGELHGVLLEGYPVLVVRDAGGEPRAFRNACPGSILPLHLGELADGTIRCPWHSCRFDAVTGEPLEGTTGALVGLPLRIEGGVVTVEPR